MEDSTANRAQPEECPIVDGGHDHGSTGSSPRQIHGVAVEELIQLNVRLGFSLVGEVPFEGDGLVRSGGIEDAQADTVFEGTAEGEERWKINKRRPSLTSQVNSQRLRNSAWLLHLPHAVFIRSKLTR